MHAESPAYRIGPKTPPHTLPRQPLPPPAQPHAHTPVVQALPAYSTTAPPLPTTARFYSPMDSPLAAARAAQSARLPSFLAPAAAPHEAGLDVGGGLAISDAEGAPMCSRSNLSPARRIDHPPAAPPVAHHFATRHDTHNSELPAPSGEGVGVSRAFARRPADLEAPGSARMPPRIPIWTTPLPAEYHQGNGGGASPSGLPTAMTSGRE